MLPQPSPPLAVIGLAARHYRPEPGSVPENAQMGELVDYDRL